MDAALAKLRGDGLEVREGDVAWLPPFVGDHINILGRYLFNIKASGPGQGLRPFRDSDAIEDDED